MAEGAAKRSESDPGEDTGSVPRWQPAYHGGSTPGTEPAGSAEAVSRDAGSAAGKPTGTEADPPEWRPREAPAAPGTRASRWSGRTGKVVAAVAIVVAAGAVLAGALGMWD